jgi:hypothetical protein
MIIGSETGEAKITRLMAIVLRSVRCDPIGSVGINRFQNGLFTPSC